MKNSRTAKSTAVAVGITLIVILATVIGVAAVLTFLGLQNAHVNKVLAVRAYVDDVYWAPDTSVNWTSLNPGQTYMKNLTVFNGSNDFINVSVIITGLPEFWTETWTANETKNLPRNTSVYGNLTLTVPVDAAAGNYSWSTSLDVT
jgi:hypothetical protein